MFTLVKCAVTDNVHSTSAQPRCSLRILIVMSVHQCLGHFLYFHAASFGGVIAHNLLKFPFFSASATYEDLPPSMIKKLAKELKNLDKSMPKGISVGVNDDDFSVSEADIEVPGMQFSP
ncbi:hypothetical protein DKX38_016102 [Salix brachista]|uniref:UBC core domain-containing protein n=1 Tax=Salix brachista TaxID=2182728 RepID=A0A5N5L737_9ROSI|nr:hypothetical protein DKX38_016102 [Salix brachista]